MQYIFSADFGTLSRIFLERSFSMDLGVLHSVTHLVRDVPFISILTYNSIILRFTETFRKNKILFFGTSFSFTLKSCFCIKELLMYNMTSCLSIFVFDRLSICLFVNIIVYFSICPCFRVFNFQYLRFYRPICPCWSVPIDLTLLLWVVFGSKFLCGPLG